MDSHVCLDVEAEGLEVEGGHAQGEVPSLGPGAAGVAGLDGGNEVDYFEKGKNFSVVYQASAVSIIDGFTFWGYHICDGFYTVRFNTFLLSAGGHVLMFDLI